MRIAEKKFELIFIDGNKRASYDHSKAAHDR